MKYLFLLYILFPFYLSAQFDNLKLENTQIFFEKVYPVDSLKIGDIEKLLLTGVPKLKDVTSFEKAQDIIIAKINNTLIDYKKYGGSWGSTAVFLNHPFFADVSIVWKDGKYKVTVSNMYFNTAGFGIMKCSDIFTKNRGTELSTNNNVVEAGQYIEKYLADLFLIKQDKNDW
jgi:hypothetical protein